MVNVLSLSPIIIVARRSCIIPLRSDYIVLCSLLAFILFLCLFFFPLISCARSGINAGKIASNSAEICPIRQFSVGEWKTRKTTTNKTDEFRCFIFILNCQARYSQLSVKKMVLIMAFRLPFEIDIFFVPALGVGACNSMRNESASVFSFFANEIKLPTGEFWFCFESTQNWKKVSFRNH